MTAALAAPALDQIFREARTRNGFKPEPLPESLLREVYDLAKWGRRPPTPRRPASSS
jgi:3-hydroxypropanoate dehydrogenase